MLHRRNYFDSAASTAIDPRVRRALRRIENNPGNPGALHREGQRAIAALDGAREDAARILSVDFQDITFVSSATEANNAALRGIAAAAQKIVRRPRIIISAIEHESVRETAHTLARLGVEVVELPVRRSGAVDPAVLAQKLSHEVVLVSVMAVNNETGVIQPVHTIAEMVRAHRGTHRFPLFHTDAAQVGPATPLAPLLGTADLATVSSHKMGGPRGAAAFIMRMGVPFESSMTGGGQEYGVRSGTENVPAIVGFVRALHLAAEEWLSDGARYVRLGKTLLTELSRKRVRYEINGSRDAYQNPKADHAFSHRARMLRSPHIVNIFLPGNSAERMLFQLDQAGFAVAAGSACRARSLKPSPVLQAMGYDKRRAGESVRVSFGREIAVEQVRALARAIARAVVRH